MGTMAFVLSLVIAVVVSVDLSAGQRNIGGGHHYQALPWCARDNQVRAEYCARDKSGVTAADQGNQARVCCYEWILEDCWDRLNHKSCAPVDYRVWQQFKRDQITSIESAECRRHPYQPGLHTCTGGLDTGSFYRPEADDSSPNAGSRSVPTIGLLTIVLIIVTCIIVSCLD